MPTAARRAADAAKAARRAPTEPPAAPPAAPPEEVVEALQPDPEPDPVPEPELPPVDPLAWIPMGEQPPFDVHAQGREPHGPYQLQLNGRAHDTDKGEVVLASWAGGGTISGGFGWGWRARDGRTFGWGAVTAWRLPTE